MSRTELRIKKLNPDKNWLLGIILVLFLMFVFRDRFAPPDNPFSETSKTKSISISPSGQPDKEQVLINVALVVINPKDENGIGVIEKYGWKQPETLSNQYISAVSEASEKTIQYKVTKVIQLDEFPEKKSGFTLDHEYYKECLQSPDANCRELINYKKFFDKLNICSDIAQGKIDEIWAFNGPWFGFWEWSVKGGKINSLQENLPDCGGKTYAIMGFSYERSLSEMLEDLGHRFEAVMVQITSARQDWKLFESKNYCGTVHIPPNGSKDYDWSNSRKVKSYCDGFSDYPVIMKTLSEMSCSTWGCTGEGYKKWWLSHIPDVWWKYVLDTDNQFQQL